MFQFKYKTILVGLLYTPLIIAYPFMKRITFWPQLFLGIIFNAGIIICSVELYGTLTLEYLIFYLSCIFWTIGYDTIYAYQDLEDDKNNNIKSTAVLLGDKGKILVFFCYIIMFIFIAFLTFSKTKDMLVLAILTLIFIYILYNIFKWDIKSKDNSGEKFRQNNLFGAMIFLYLLSF